MLLKECKAQSPGPSGPFLFGEKSMKYQYRFKDKSLEQALNVIYGEEFVEDQVNRQMTNTTSYICFEIDHSSTTISKGEIAEIKEYDPDDWNPFPEVNPPECGEYLVTFEDEDADYVQQNYFNNLGKWETAHSDVIAFRALPAPYQPEARK